MPKAQAIPWAFGSLAGLRDACRLYGLRQFNPCEDLTVRHPGRYTGTYGQFRTDYILNSHISLALEVVHFAIGDALREAGGHDSNYVGAEFKYGW
jgi:Alginate export